MHRTDLAESGFAQRGFNETEQRMCMGGYCWRKYDPTSSSKRWGLDYESWEFQSATTSFAVESVMGADCKVTRLDIAYDFDVPDDLMPSAVEDLVRDYCKDKRIGIHHVGPADSYTVYVGSRKSERMVRIYRRDKKDQLLEMEGRCILRVELELKKAQAHSMYLHMLQTGSDGFWEGSAHIRELMGYGTLPFASETPPLIRTREDTQAAQMLFAFVKQSATMLRAAEVCGIDLHKLARSKLSDPSRLQRHRLDSKVQTMGLCDPESLMKTVEQMMRV